MVMEARIFGERLKQLREDSGLTQEKLAQAANLTTSFVSTLERGGKVPSLTSVLKIARALKQDASALLVDFNYDAMRKMKF
ncbi:MAG TPA: helix-turn-helix transcriptional regulator [Thermoanaerobaculia bacterium]|nr:helix-turn-helix transcriptional regulator [Thermoanaerobaculia bacterium]